MVSKKGYVSFALFFIICTGLLLLSVPPAKTESILPSYIYKYTHNTHIQLKRSFAPSAKTALERAQQQITVFKKTGQLAFGTGTIATPELTADLEDEFIKASILYEFEKMLSSYSNISDFDSYYYCSGESSPPSLKFPPKIRELYISCSDKLSVSHLKSGGTKVYAEGFSLFTSHKLSEISMDSKIEPFEVG